MLAHNRERNLGDVDRAFEAYDAIVGGNGVRCAISTFQLFK